jgi:hypothetical protein
MLRIQGVRRALLASLIVTGLVSAASAQTSTPATGLGQSWPNAADVSANPNWHVYVFFLDGIKYVQINDLNGGVHAALSTAAGTVLVLPVGRDSRNVKTSPATNSSGGQTVYRDTTTTIIAIYQPDGTTHFQVTKDCSNPYTCSAATTNIPNG